MSLAQSARFPMVSHCPHLFCHLRWDSWNKKHARKEPLGAWESSHTHGALPLHHCLCFGFETLVYSLMTDCICVQTCMVFQDCWISQRLSVMFPNDLVNQKSRLQWLMDFICLFQESESLQTRQYTKPAMCTLFNARCWLADCIEAYRLMQQ